MRMICYFREHPIASAEHRTFQQTEPSRGQAAVLVARLQLPPKVYILKRLRLYPRVL